MTRIACHSAVCAFAIAIARTAVAQSVRGTIVDNAGHPVEGAVVLLLDDASRPAARGLSSASGAFLLRAGQGGRYRLRTVRIGFRPVMAEAFTLRPDETVEQKVVVDPIAIGLDTVRSEEKASCRRLASDSVGIVFAAWEQARAALIATHLTATGRGITATAVDFDRVLESNSNRIQTQVAHVRTEYVRQPWRSLAPDSLRRNGYVVTGPGDVVTYYAPGLDVLLDETFAEDHCIRISKASNSATLAIDFEPVPERTRTPEIRGSLWLDRHSSELQRLEFTYLNIPSEEAQVAAGDMNFSRLKNGGWVVSRWQIRMPVLERVGDQSVRVQRIHEVGLRVSEVHVSGGALITVLAGRDTVWSHAPVRLEGVVLDSVSGRPVSPSSVVLRGTESRGVADARGHFSIASVLPGEYTIDVRTPSLDSLNAVVSRPVIVEDSATSVELRIPTGAQMSVALCPSASKTAPGILIGRLTTGLADSLPKGARVFAEWVNIRLKDGGVGPSVVRERQWAEATATSDGSFRFCGVPMNTSITLSAAAEGLESPQSIETRIPPFTQFARVEVPLARMLKGAATFAGTVFADSSGEGVSGAEVELLDLQRTTRTSPTGAFRLTGLPPGNHRLSVRRLGFAPMEADVTLPSGRIVDQRISLRSVTILESVRILDKNVDRSMSSFADHRATGLGHFLDRSELVKFETLNMGAVLQSLPGLRVVRGRSNQIWVISGKGSQSLTGRDLRGGDDADRLAGARPDCYARVYIDRRVAYAAKDGEPLFDFGRVRPDEIEAIEYYTGAAETPVEYSTLESTCGVVVIWTRR